MNENFYKKVIEESPTGYAYHKIICDKDGNPCDYEFIEVNNAFEKLTGLKGSNIVGRKISKVLPNIKNSKFDWINLYGDIAINGGKKELEKFSEVLQCWYKITIYSPEKYYFITHFIDITKQMSQLSGMERLIETSEEFLQINEQKIDYQKITDDFLKICGARYAFFNLFDEDGKNFTTMALAGEEGMAKKISYILNFKIEGNRWEYKQAMSEKIKDATITRFNSLAEFTENVLPTPLVAIFEKAFSAGEVIVITISRNNILLGHFILFMKKNEKFDKYTLTEVYTRQLGMVILRKRAEDNLLREKILTDAIFNNVPCMISLYDNQSRLVRWNKKHEDITGYSSQELSNMSYWDWFKEDEKGHKAIVEGITRASEEGFDDGEAWLQKKDGTRVPMYFTGSDIYLDGNPYFACIAIDITERKKKDEEIYYLSYRDQLTGLYNRRFYEEELKRIDTARNLPMTIVMGDVNGLKLINDSFGHAIGDELLKKVAQVMKFGCRNDEVIARLGGDEFVIILPKTDSLAAEQIIKRITTASLSEKVGFIDISISFGYETKYDEKDKIEKILKNADDRMYKKKLSESTDMRVKTIKAIINTLQERDKREEQHSQSVSKLCKNMGEALGLSHHVITQLMEVGLLHDIGNIAIDENILSISGKLTIDEWEEIKRHPEISYRILNTVNNMSDIAIGVLYHHERWDGKGYPKGLKGEDIPLVSRIVAIADAYDAMTNERGYKKTLRGKVAIQELQKNAGIQFDAELVNVFIEKVLVEYREL